MREVWMPLCLVAVLAAFSAGCTGDGGPEAGPSAEVATPAEEATLKDRQVRFSALGQPRVDLKGSPVDAAIGGRSLWVLSTSGRSRPGHLTQVGLHSGQVLSTHEIPQPQAVTFRQGSVWVADSSGNRVLRFDSKSGRRLASIPLSLPRPVGKGPDRWDFLPFDIAAGEGAIWVATFRGFVAEIDPGCNCVVRQIPIPLQSMATIAAGEGAVWIGGDLDGMIRIDPESGEKVRIPIEGSGGRRLGVGDIRTAEGRVWVAGSWAALVKRETSAPISGIYVDTDDSTIIELSPSGDVLGKTDSPSGTVIPPGIGNSIWAAGWKSRNIYVLDPSPPALHRVWRLSRPAHLLATSDRSIWLVKDGNTLVRRFLIVGPSAATDLANLEPGAARSSAQAPFIRPCEALVRRPGQMFVDSPSDVRFGKLVFRSLRGIGIADSRNAGLFKTSPEPVASWRAFKALVTIEGGAGALVSLSPRVQRSFLLGYDPAHYKGLGRRGLLFTKSDGQAAVRFGGCLNRPPEGESQFIGGVLARRPGCYRIRVHLDGAPRPIVQTVNVAMEEGKC